MSKTEFIFLGTGTSSSVPNLSCLTAPPEKEPCRTCLSSLTPEGQKNKRRNTGAVVRIPAPNEPERRDVTILIDAGKTFQAGAIEHFPRFGLRELDAVLISHAHADADGGLDDLRGWTLNGAIQKHIDIYCSEDTFNEVKRAFPYLVSKEFATGGGDVPELDWHIIYDKIAFEIGNTGVYVTPFLVHHGRIFTAPPPTDLLPTPPSTGHSSPQLKAEPLHGPDAAIISDNVIQPYLAFGFKIQEDVVYISDTSHIPDEVWPLLKSHGHERLPVLALDCLHIREHPSHLSLEQAYRIARKINARRCYLTGFSHEISHEEYVRIAEVVESGGIIPSGLSKHEQDGVEAALLSVGREDSDVMWLRPAHDGLLVLIENGEPVDETYKV